MNKLVKHLINDAWGFNIERCSIQPIVEQRKGSGVRELSKVFAFVKNNVCCCPGGARKSTI